MSDTDISESTIQLIIVSCCQSIFVIFDLNVGLNSNSLYIIIVLIHHVVSTRVNVKTKNVAIRIGAIIKILLVPKTSSIEHIVHRTAVGI